MHNSHVGSSHRVEVHLGNCRARSVKLEGVTLNEVGSDGRMVSDLFHVDRYSSQIALECLSVNGVEGFLKLHLQQRYGKHEQCDELDLLDRVIALSCLSQKQRCKPIGFSCSFQNRSVVEDLHRQRHVHNRLTFQQVGTDLLQDVLNDVLLRIDRCLIGEYHFFVFVEPPLTFVEDVVTILRYYFALILFRFKLVPMV